MAILGPASRAGLAVVVLAVAASAAGILPLGDIKPGLRGTGRTIFSGGSIETFDVEILGVLENIGPKQSLILARLSGGPLERTGVMQGMSGSPVYIDGKLIGAVAMAFPNAKEPIAGIRPIEEMLATPTAEPPQRAALSAENLLAGLPGRGEVIAGPSRMTDIATPLSLGGFTRAAVEHFAPQLRALGLEPVQGTASGGRAGLPMGDPKKLEPGSMISVQLITGDFVAGADGTVTHLDGDRIYAFGHRFLSVGPAELPFARAEVIALLPSTVSSFKISNALEPMGVITQDRNAAIAGTLGRRARMVPVSIDVQGAGRSASYRMEMVEDRYLSPFLLQMMMYSAIDATERTAGASSFRVRGEVEFDGVESPLRLDNAIASDSGAAAMASLYTALPYAYVLQTGFDRLRAKRVQLSIESRDEKDALQIDDAYADHVKVRPGQTVTVHVVLAGRNGAETIKSVSYPTPIGLSSGPLYFTVSDGMTANLAEIKQLLGATPRSPAQAVATVNRLRENDRVYVRVWRPEVAFQTEASDFPAPPPSLAMLFSRSQGRQGGLTQGYSSRIAEMSFDGTGAAISGARTFQVEVTE